MKKMPKVCTPNLRPRKQLAWSGGLFCIVLYVLENIWLTRFRHKTSTVLSTDGSKMKIDSMFIVKLSSATNLEEWVIIRVYLHQLSTCKGIVLQGMDVEIHTWYRHTCMKRIICVKYESWIIHKHKWVVFCGSPLTYSRKRFLNTQCFEIWLWSSKCDRN